MSERTNGINRINRPSPSPSENWDTLPSLEYVANTSFRIPQEKAPNTNSHITLHKCPELVSTTITYLIGKHRYLKTGANVTRVATKCGVLYLAHWEELALLKIAKDLIYEQGDERARLDVSRRSFEFKISISEIPITCYCFRYVSAMISNISLFLGLPASTVATMALIAAFSLSEEWLPRDRAQQFEQELTRSALWLKQQVKALPSQVVISQPVQKLLLSSEFYDEQDD
jgi:hypothetical protein